MTVGSKEGMQTLDQSLASLVRRGIISRDEGMLKANDIELFEKWVRHSG